MKKFIQDFKAFALKGNVVDMAVGVIIGGAFGKIVTSLVNDIMMPPISLLTGGVNFTDLKLVLSKAVVESGEVVKPEVSWNYGNFIQTTVDFLILAFVIFLMIKAIMAAKRKEEEAPAAPAPTPPEIELLTEIRDLLKKQ